jgi:hypothetical protein
VNSAPSKKTAPNKKPRTKSTTINPAAPKPAARRVIVHPGNDRLLHQ